RHLLRAGDSLQLVDGRLVIPLRAIDKAKREAIARRGHFLVSAILLEEFAEPITREGVVLLVVRAAGARQEHLCGLLLGHLCKQRRDQAEQEQYRDKSGRREIGHSVRPPGRRTDWPIGDAYAHTEGASPKTRLPGRWLQEIAVPAPGQSSRGGPTEE